MVRFSNFIKDLQLPSVHQSCILSHMAYTIHRTESYVLKSALQGEANKRIDLLTKELGVIKGTAQGVRYLKSKLRYSLSDFSRVDVALVRGKDTWRIINALKYDDLFVDLPSSYRAVFMKVFSLISRLIAGEFSEPHIYDLVRSAHLFADKNPDLTAEELFGFECLLILQLLYYLGYIGQGTILERFKGEEWNRELLVEAYKERKIIVSLINHALSHTGL